MKKIIISALIAMTVLIGAVGALYAKGGIDGFGATPTPEPTAVPTATPEPTPTPTPVPPIVVVAPAGHEGFAQAIAAVADREVVTAGSAAEAPLAEASVVAAVVTDARGAEALHRVTVPLIVYDREGTADSLTDAVTVSYSGNGYATAADALDAAIAYPPHDTPVRLIGLFEDPEGDAAQTWVRYVEGGKVLSKGTYGLKANGDVLSAWVTGRFNSYFPGMLDAAFCETPALAEQLAQQMIDAGRDDFEIFTIGTSAELLRLAAHHHRILPLSVEYNDALAYETAAELLNGILQGRKAESMVIGADGVQSAESTEAGTETEDVCTDEPPAEAETPEEGATEEQEEPKEA
ncbi:MAG: hypothetical protein Q4C53_00055 [Clostridia bacterium]|nr:hypothetical protein [Clostridia bacterium]